MKRIKFYVSVAVIIGLMLVSLGVQASGDMTVANDVFTGICTVSASFENGKNDPVSIEVIPSDVNREELNVSSDALDIALSKITYFNQTNANSNGNATFTFPLKTSGEYIFRVHSMNNSGDALEKTADVISLSDATSVWNAIISSPSDNLPLLLEILNVTDETILNMKADKDLLLAIKSYTHPGEFTRLNADALISKIKSECEAIILLRDVLNQIKNISNTTQLKSIISVAENAEILGITEYMGRYNALKNTKIADSAVAGKTYTEASTFLADFISGIEAAEKAQTQNQTSQKPLSSPSGTGGGSLGGTVSTPIVQPPVSSDLHPFTDISNVSWASDAIAFLYNQKIISGKSTNEFAPNDCITREEFVKIAIGIVGIEPNSDNCDFADVNPSQWYAPYISAAMNAGIVSGYSDTHFGVGEYITRQDVAVILDRIHNFSGAANKLEFSDNSDISDYARSAVDKLSSNGVINGADGRFMPKSNCTRAEAACMVYRMMSLMKEGK